MKLFEVKLALAKKLMEVYEGAATGGTTTTLVDGNIINPEEDNHWQWGTIFFKAWETTAIVTVWTQSSKTFGFAAQATAPQAGELYAVCDKEYTQEKMIQAINDGLQELGPVPQIYENASFITVTLQEEYSLPTGVRNVKQVYIATNTAAPYNWDPHSHWHLDHVNNKLVFETNKQPATSGLRIRLVYKGLHTAIYADSDTVSDFIHPELIAWTAAKRAFRNRIRNTESDEDWLKELYNDAVDNAKDAKATYPIPELEQQPKLANW